MSSPSDAELVARIRAGDTGTFEALFREYFAPLWRFAYRYVGTKDLAEDVVHDVFAQLWMRRAEWTVRDTVRTYLFRAVRNRTINLHEHQRVVQRVSVGETSASATVQVADPSLTPDDALANAEQRAHARTLVQSLPEPRRSAVMLRYYEELSFAEIAEVLGVSVRAAEMLVARGVQSLRGR